MKIIIAPAKQMKNDEAFLRPLHQPIFLKKTQQLLNVLRNKTPAQLQVLLKCNPTIARQTYMLYQTMDLQLRGSPALLSYRGIQYTYMAPHIFLDELTEYVEKHVRILSGFYGLLRPLDSVLPHRLEMDNPFQTDFCNSLYDFWGDQLYRQLVQEDSIILDLASAQHARSVKAYVQEPIRYIKCYFMEQENGQLREKGVYVKMARGEMVRFLAEQNAQEPEVSKSFHRLGYQFQEELSSSTCYVFTRPKRL